MAASPLPSAAAALDVLAGFFFFLLYWKTSSPEYFLYQVDSLPYDAADSKKNHSIVGKI